MTQQQDRIEVRSPVGRIVAGNPWEGSTTDAKGNPLLIKNGANKGQPRTSWYVGLAIEKNCAEWPAFWQKLTEAARLHFPQLSFDANGNCVTNPHFAWKVTDGDSNILNENNVRPCDKTGYPGHWVVNFSNGFAPTCFSSGGTQILTDPSTIKKGYYVRIYANVAGNGDQSKPGIFINHTLIELAGYGEEIISGPNGAVVFADAPTILPAGMSSIPVGAQTGPATGPGGPGGPAAGAGVAPGPGGPAAGAGVAPGPGGPGQGPGAPATDYLNPANKMYTVQGKQFTEAQLRAANWSDQQIAALGQ